MGQSAYYAVQLLVNTLMGLWTLSIPPYTWAEVAMTAIPECQVAKMHVLHTVFMVWTAVQLVAECGKVTYHRIRADMIIHHITTLILCFISSPLSPTLHHSLPLVGYVVMRVTLMAEPAVDLYFLTRNKPHSFLNQAAQVLMATFFVWTRGVTYYTHVTRFQHITTLDLIGGWPGHVMWAGLWIIQLLQWFFCWSIVKKVAQLLSPRQKDQ